MIKPPLMYVPKPKFSAGDRVRLKRYSDHGPGTVQLRTYDNTVHANAWGYQIKWDTWIGIGTFFCHDLEFYVERD